MEDDHVDRLDVEVQQCMKLTSTNSSIGLIVLIACVHGFVLTDERGFAAILRTGRAKVRDGHSALRALPVSDDIYQLLICFAFGRPGGYCGAAAPVPIPNTAVKRPSADGTLS